jgi:2-succinyl-6-hydroxy-2,4-cyclohexadiene-1-carboxylate synthase
MNQDPGNASQPRRPAGLARDTSSLPFEVHRGNGPPLLLVHGFLSSPAQWLDNLAALGEHCTPVTVRLWGHAGAPHPDDAAYTPDAYVDAFEAIRRELGAERWWLLGYSLGAGLTIRYALTHPDRVIGHAFTNSTSALADAGQRRRWQAEAAAAAERIVSGGPSAMARIPVHPRHARRLPAHLHQALCADADRHDPAGIAATLLYTNPDVSVRERVGENVRPALLICGSREKRFLPLRDHAAAHMPHLTIREVDGGHGMNMEVPAAFNAAVIDFLRDTAEPPTRRRLRSS